ncbi:MAG: GNAT family N-acetyltransferase [Oscillospiraceae bacterium]|nr:GNAT family N-acetyltransferase [Oscillospiraceae bacterium]
MLELARPEDRSDVNRLARQVHAMHVAWRPDIYEMVEELYSRQRFADAIAERQLYVAKPDGIIVGFVLVKIRSYDWPGVVNRKVMVVDEVCVEEALRNQGIGRAMMEDVHALAKAYDCTDLQLGVYPQNDAAVAFYQKCGFTIRSIDMQRKV